MSRCTGHCCREFYLPYTYDELREHYRRWREQLQPMDKVPQDIFLVYPMVIPGKDANHYNCKHLMPGGDCSIYEHRPRVCSEYPYGRKCDREGCTLR